MNRLLQRRSRNSFLAPVPGLTLSVDAIQGFSGQFQEKRDNFRLRAVFATHFASGEIPDKRGDLIRSRALQSVLAHHRNAELFL